VRILNSEQGWIGYRLNLLGIRVHQDGCFLVAKFSPSEWKTVGPKRPLPVKIPSSANQLKAEGDDALLGTAFQYMAAHPESDLGDLLEQKKDFNLAIGSI
jgi:hypothetical protein